MAKVSEKNKVADVEVVSDPVPDVQEGVLPAEAYGPEAVEAAVAQVEQIDTQDLMEKALELVAERQRGELVEPEDDELDEDILFVRNGWIRVVIAGRKHKLRRPFLGELRDLETSMEADIEVLETEQKGIQTQAETALARVREIGVEAEGLDPGDVERKTELDGEATRLGVEISHLSNLLVRKSYDLREAWWIEVFKVLTPPGQEAPEQMPSWVGDANLQARVVQHWRAVPLGSGR